MALRSSYNASKLKLLQAAASEAQAMNWSPYSGFQVLAVIETIDGQLYSGSNVENANYTLTVHAEQNAILAALRDGVLQRCGREFIAVIYVACAFEGAPCGSCRQAINEFATPQCLWVGEDTRDNSILCCSLTELLPLDFGPRHLGIDYSS